jgi:LAS superfamily LD-carboxypeptidase LdcB
VVNSRISGAAFALVEAAKADGVPLTATSSFRQEVHQRDLFQCYVDQKPGCLQAAEPGYSVHQMGLALDFALPRSYDTCDGGNAADNPAWKWLRENAGEYGFRQLRAENWHWDTTSSDVNPMCP